MVRAALAFAMFATPATAQQLPYSDTIRVLSEGRVISAQQGDYSLVSALHEVFVLHGTSLFLCHLRGSTTSGTAPNASCWGPRP